MALTIRQITEEQKETAKALTGKGAASAAVTACVGLAADYKSRYERGLQENQRLLDEVRHLESVLSRLGSAADEALCIIRQKELLR